MVIAELLQVLVIDIVTVAVVVAGCERVQGNTVGIADVVVGVRWMERAGTFGIQIGIETIIEISTSSGVLLIIIDDAPRRDRIKGRFIAVEVGSTRKLLNIVPRVISSGVVMRIGLLQVLHSALTIVMGGLPTVVDGVLMEVTL